METNKFFYNIIYYNKIKNSSNNEINDKNNDCIGPCYPPNTLYYHPTHLVAVYDDEDNTCPIMRDVESGLIDYTKKCNIDEVQDINDKILFISFSKNSFSFLKDIYDIKNFDDVINYLNINIRNLPIFSQKRILNSIYNAYINNDNFPNKKFIYRVKNVLEIVYNLKLSSKKIYDEIINIRNKKKYNINNDIFIYLFNKYFK